MKCLLYSFEPFGNISINSAAEIAKKVVERNPSICFIILPVTFHCGDLLEEQMQRFQPDLIIGLGVAMGYSRVSIERYALNEMSARIPDNEGYRPLFERIRKEGPDAYRTHINLKRVFSIFQNHEVPVQYSFHAGTYVCNYTYYCALEYASKHDKNALFIHFPLSPQVVIQNDLNQPSLPCDPSCESLLELIQEGV